MNKFVVVDIETTGNSLKKGDRIIQFAAVIIENGAIVDTYTTYINPEIMISPFITELTGIDNTTVADAPLFHEVADSIANLLEDACFVAHNVHFDLNFLQDELELAGLPKLACPIIDTVEMSRILMPTLDSYKLNDIAIVAGFDHDRPHQADSDAFVTAEWFLSLYDKALQLPTELLNQLYKLSKLLKTNVAELFSYLIRNKANQQQIPETLQFFRGLMLKKVQIAPITHSEPVAFPSDRKEKMELLQKGYSAQYEERTEQGDMIQFVYDSLREGDITLVEAEPGFGKTISYLLPAAIFSINKEQPVIIATHTILQQHQIIENELPRLNKMLNKKINVQVIKGKSHYLNLWKFERILRQENEHYDEIITKMQILVWLTETETGDVDELNLSSGGIHFWYRVSSTSVENETEINPWGKMEFYQRAMYRAANANLIITNHHFLLADVTGNIRFLPSYDYVIIDEAHHFEKNATKFYGNQISYRKMKYLLGQLGTVEQQKLLGKIYRLLIDKNIHMQTNATTLNKHIESFTNMCEEFFQLCLSFSKKRQKNAYGKVSTSISFLDNSRLTYAWERLYDAFTILYEDFENYYEKLSNMYSLLSEAEKIILEDFLLLLLDFQTMERFHQDVFYQQDVIIWMETDDRSPLPSLVLYSQPLFVGEQLAETLYSEKKSIIFTSATLTVKNSFAYIMEQLGLNHFPVHYNQYKAPFSYTNQVNLYAMEDLPNISEVDEQEFIATISSYITSIAEAVEGRMLILFTSHEMLKHTYYLVKESGLLEDYVLLAQGISGGSSQRLRKQFGRFDKAILFGSYTFWEGMDIGKDALSAIIMIRLPFTSPKEPVHHGKVQLLKEQGKSAFYEFSLPEAVIRFKQGFGRLIRSKEDTGNFIIFDKRIYTSKYGTTFLQSIPKTPLQLMTIDALCNKLEANRVGTNSKDPED
ncbi:ATP-dependent DNA helicase DinG [Caldibacillus lycopersici]|uniref:3'-5' exonuclease DinG n=1 Tax=Perspicuibacillus lycopersici TaxID=1325689 RepID=A0AAE3IUK2_9BACI|nr:ATP-dependent DNA helicase DinG [Perspicuibacillus lycopersici]MCU9613684.1 ATP-dependent DNA helicase DinG [Perspicuibacillus lycopersici]